MNAWSRFWRKGHITSFAQYFSDGYGKAIQDWLDDVDNQIHQLDHHTVLELCSGNCSLLPFVIDAVEAFDYIGIDSADVSLPEVMKRRLTASHNKATVASNVSVESLPNIIQNVTLALSIYGIEYSRIEETVSGLLPRMRPQGKLFGLIHHSESEVKQSALRMLDQYNQIDLDTINDSLNTLNRTSDCPEAKNKFNSICDKYMHGITSQTRNRFMVERVLRSLSFFEMTNISFEDKASFIDELEQEAFAERLCNEQMVNSAKTKSEMYDLADYMRSIGWANVFFKEQTYQGAILGWSLTATVN